MDSSSHLSVPGGHPPLGILTKRDAPSVRINIQTADNGHLNLSKQSSSLTFGIEVLRPLPSSRVTLKRTISTRRSAGYK
jgi:hypothetical protein